MTPKEKAEYLVRFFEDINPVKLSDHSRIYTPTAKVFATKVCDEVLGHIRLESGHEYWTEVKQEIENL